DQLSKSLLHVAAETGDVPMVKALLAVGASADFENECGWTALQYASGNGHAECCIGHLLKCGARIDRKSDDGLSALHHAAESGAKLDVECLIRAGANVNL
ncbi:hypothetical protein AURANDRAFT_15731, partial [Aureococcus anophagefferens]